MHLIEPYLAFYDEDFAMLTVVQRQPWPLRPGRTLDLPVCKLSITDPDRNTRFEAASGAMSFSCLRAALGSIPSATTRSARKTLLYMTFKSYVTGPRPTRQDVRG